MQTTKQRTSIPEYKKIATPGINLHLGCGLNFIEGWTNIDGSLGVLIAKIPGLHPLLRLILGNQPFLMSKWNPRIHFHDIRTPLPHKNESVATIYSSHVLEHLYKSEQEKLISECYRLLAPNGLIRIVVPDLAYIVQQYVSSQPKETAADQLNQMMCSHPLSPYAGNFIYRLLKKLNSFQEHRWMHDSYSLTTLLSSKGFRHIRVCQPLDSRIPGIEHIENHHGIDSLYIEAQR